MNDTTKVMIQAPPSPDVTQAQSRSILLSIVGIIAAFTLSEDRVIQLATVISAAVLGCVWMISDTMIRRIRNQRVATENVSTIESATNLQMQSMEIQANKDNGGE